MISYIVGAILFSAIAFISGESVWSMIRGACFAVFGVGFFVLIITMISTAMRIAGGKFDKSLTSNNLSAIGLAVVFSSLVNVIANMNSAVDTSSWWSQISNSTILSYEAGKSGFELSTGFFGSFVGESLSLTITTIPAIILLILAFVVLAVIHSNNGFNYYGMKISELFQDNQEKRSVNQENKKIIKQERKAEKEEKLAAAPWISSEKSNEPVLSKHKPSKSEFEQIPIQTSEPRVVEEKSKTAVRGVLFGGKKKAQVDIEVAPDDSVEVAANRAKLFYPEIDGTFEEIATDIQKNEFAAHVQPETVEDDINETLPVQGTSIDKVSEPNYRPVVNPFAAKSAVEVKEEPEQIKVVSSELAQEEQEIIKDAINTAKAHEQKSIEEIDESKSETKLRKKYSLPPLECLTPPIFEQNQDYTAEIRLTAKRLVDTLKSFNVETKLIGVSRGPTVTRYELQPAKGVKISKITNLSDDIALSLASSGVRIEAPIPNKPAVGIEVPNKIKSNVTFREMISSSEFKNGKSKINVVLGKDISGENICADLGKMPHLLIAGTTGSGKSVCLNSMITSILFNATCEEVKLLMIDPKQVEFSVYNGIPHLLVPVISDPRKAGGSLAWAVGEMENRYKLFSTFSVRDITGFNKMAMNNPDVQYMPQIVIFIDELNDLMMLSPKEVENSICRLAQKARAAGMHLVVATQRPSVDVITGLIKANIPSRISLSVSSRVDSRTILDSYGAEKLLGNGDMLYYPTGLPKPVRIQGAYLSDEEIQDVVAFLKEQDEAHYDEEIMSEIEKNAVVDKKDKGASTVSGDAKSNLDPLFERALELVVENQSASTSLLQRHLQVGFARAARITDQLYENGMIGPPGGAKGRKVLITPSQLMEMKAVNDAAED